MNNNVKAVLTEEKKKISDKIANYNDIKKQAEEEIVKLEKKINAISVLMADDDDVEFVAKPTVVNAVVADGVIC